MKYFWKAVNRNVLDRTGWRNCVSVLVLEEQRAVEMTCQARKGQLNHHHQVPTRHLSPALRVKLNTLFTDD